MLVNTYPYCFIYNDIEKVELYWKKFKPDSDVIVRHSEKWRVLIPLFEQISSQNCVLIFIWNAATNRFIYAVDNRNVVGYEPALYLADNGIDFSMSNVHPDFLTSSLTMNQKAFEYTMPKKGEEQNKIIVNFDGMYKKSNGEYMHFLQQIVRIEDDVKGYGLLYLSYIQDITYFKKAKTANLVIRTHDGVKMWNFNFSNNCLEPIQPISRQEKKVLAYLGKGKSSKEIAKELFTSPHTIDTHRRNLLKKTNCIDTTGLVMYAKLVGLL